MWQCLESIQKQSLNSPIFFCFCRKAPPLVVSCVLLLDVIADDHPGEGWIDFSAHRARRRGDSSRGLAVDIWIIYGGRSSGQDMALAILECVSALWWSQIQRQSNAGAIGMCLILGENMALWFCSFALCFSIAQMLFSSIGTLCWGKSYLLEPSQYLKVIM